MKPMSRNRLFRPRGATLVELLVASAVGGLVMLSTLTVFNATRAAQTNSERLVTSFQSLSLAMLSMQRHLENAGYRFPGQSVKLHNNVTVGSKYYNGPGGGTDLDVVNEGAASAGIIAGTDVIDVYIGDSNRLIGTATGVLPSGDFFLVSLDSNAPLKTIEIGRYAQSIKGPMVVFSDGPTSCLGLFLGKAASGGTQYQVQIYDFFGVSATGVENCPAPGMRVFGLSERRRYMVYKEAGTNSVAGLYGQTSLALANGFQNAGTLGAPFLLARGVDNMQLSPLLANTNNELSCGTNQPYCSCRESNSNCPSDRLDKVSLFRGVKSVLVSKGLEPVLRMGAKPPAVFDQPGNNTVDNIDRQLLKGFVDFPNINPAWVNPL